MLEIHSTTGHGDNASGVMRINAVAVFTSYLNARSGVDTIMATAQARRIGYLGWSWSGDSSDVGYPDMTDRFNANSLTGWGQRASTAPTTSGSSPSIRPSVYSGDTPTTPPAGGGGTVPH